LLGWLFEAVAVLCAGLLLSVPARAQVAGATLSGTVADNSGAVVPNVSVTAKNMATSVATPTTTNTVGAYSIPDLTPGDYSVSASIRGFRTTVTTLTLTVGQEQLLNITLTVGQVEQQVTVTGAAPMVELESSTVSNEVSASTVRDLPLNGRDWTALATLQPGVAEVHSQLSVEGSAIAAGRGLGEQMSVGGGRPTQNSYRLDGVVTNDYSNAGPGSVLGKNLGVDAIQEFSVLTSDYSAEYGFTSGGVINATTRSGTNSFHGSAFDFLRNDALDASNFFNDHDNLPKNSLRQNQFGASAGWRVLKDKLFLFGDYEGVRFSQGVPHSADTTLTPAVKAGTVTNLFTGATTTVPVDPNIQKFLGFWPAPSANYLTPGGVGCLPLAAGTYSPGSCNPNVAKFVWQGANVAHENFYTIRGDDKLSDKDSLFITYLHDYSLLTEPVTLDTITTNYDSWREAAIMQWTHVFTPSVVNSFRMGLDRTSDVGGQAGSAINPLAANTSLAMASGFFSPNIAVTGPGVSADTSGLLWNGSIQNYHGQLFQVYDDAFWTLGKHQFKFGFEFMDDQTDGYHPLSGGNGNGNGTFSYVGTYPVVGGSTKVATATEGNVPGGGSCFNPAKAATTANLANGNNYEPSCGGLVNFLTNQPLSAYQPTDTSPGSLPFHHLRDKIFGAYMQDDWRFRSNLTLNLGIRYEMSTIPTESDGLVANMTSITQMLPCYPAASTCANPVNPTPLLSNTFFTHNPTLLNFEPRIGFAWDPFRNGKTSIRGGFGIFDALPLPYELILNSVSTAPFRNIRTVLGPPGVLSPNSLAGAPDQFPFNIVADSGISGVPPISETNTRTWNWVQRDPDRNYVYQYNLNIQHQLASNVTLLVGYLGSRGLHNPFQDDTINTIIPQSVPGVGLVWPGCFGPASATAAGQAACLTAGTTFTGNLSATAQQNLLLNPSTASIPSTMWDSSSFYNALTVNVQKRLSRGVQLQASYTWSKSIDDSSGSAAGDTFAFDYTSLPWYNMSLNKGLSDFNVSQNLVINAIWVVPTTKSLGAIGERALGGWQLGAIVTLQTGVPTFPSITTDMVGEDLTTVQPPNVVRGCNLVNSNYRQSLFYANSSCYTLVPMTSANSAFCDQRLAANTCSNIRGNEGRNTLIGPGITNFDFSMFKNNYLTKNSEALNLQFRAEFFNVLNHPNFAPSGNLNMFTALGQPVSTFGEITSTSTDNRVVQLALKLIW
jgi:hypothetical protein